jgi:hypothetical protein
MTKRIGKIILFLYLPKKSPENLQSSILPHLLVECRMVEERTLEIWMNRTGIVSVIVQHHWAFDGHLLG